MNYLQLQQQVAAWLNRPDLLVPVAPAITSAIYDFTQDRIFYWQKALYSPSEQLNYDITTIPHQSEYAFNAYPGLRGLQCVLFVRLLQGTQIWIPLSRVHWYNEILLADVLAPSFVSLPSYWATYGQTLRLYPTPNDNYPLELMCNAGPPAPIADTDDNFWTSDASALIIRSTCAEICAQYLNDLPRAEIFMQSTQREADSLKNYTMRLRGPSYVRPYL